MKFSVLDRLLEKEKKEDASNRIRNPLNENQKTARLMELEDLQDDEELPRNKRSELKRLRQQVRKPTLRQRLFGFRPGKLSAEDEKYLQAHISTQNMLRLVKRFGKNRIKKETVNA